MQYYFAPLEGLTDATYRAVHHKYFPGVDRYYTPFFSPTVHRCLTPREARELPPAHTLDAVVIPRLLTLLIGPLPGTTEGIIPVSALRTGIRLCLLGIFDLFVSRIHLLHLLGSHRIAGV